MTVSSSTHAAANQTGARMLALFVVVLVLAASFGLGLLVGSRRLHGLPSPPRAVSPPLSGPTAADEDLSPERLLEEMRVRMSHLERREAELRREVREAEVAFHLLRAKGEAVDGPACREQQARDRAASASLAQLRQEKVGLTQLQSDLRRALGEDRGSREAAAADPVLRRRVQVYLTRRSLLRELSPPESGADLREGP